MSFARHFLVCDSLEHAALLDGIALQFMLGDNENGAVEWSGVYVKPGLLADTYGVVWKSPLVELLGEANTLPVVAEVKDEDGVSDWQRLPAPEPESP